MCNDIHLVPLQGHLLAGDAQGSLLQDSLTPGRLGCGDGNRAIVRRLAVFCSVEDCPSLNPSCPSHLSSHRDVVESRRKRKELTDALSHQAEELGQAWAEVSGLPQGHVDPVVMAVVQVSCS